MKIPLSRTSLGAEEVKVAAETMESGWVVMGKKTVEFEQEFARYVGAKYAVFVDSCTSALFLALKAKNWPKGTPVAIPSFTFTADPEAIIHAGYTPKFIDVELDTLCMKQYFGPCVPVHMSGNKSDVNSFIYDSAHRIEPNDLNGSTSMTCYSFYATKNMTTIQGGMIALNDQKTYEWLKLARDHGMTKGTLERTNSLDPIYDVEFVGWRVKPDDVRAAIGLSQLKKLPELQRRRNRIVGLYNDAFGYKRTGNHFYPILVEDRQKFFQYMHDSEIGYTVHYRPLHQMKAYKYYCNYSLHNTEYLGEHVVSIPLFPQMTDEEISYVVDRVKKSKQLIK